MNKGDSFVIIESRKRHSRRRANSMRPLSSENQYVLNNTRRRRILCWPSAGSIVLMLFLICATEYVVVIVAQTEEPLPETTQTPSSLDDAATSQQPTILPEEEATTNQPSRKDPELHEETFEPTTTTIPTQKPSVSYKPTNSPRPTITPKPTLTLPPSPFPTATVEPSIKPSLTIEPTITLTPTEQPTSAPSSAPTVVASNTPSYSPTQTPQPSVHPTPPPSRLPTTSFSPSLEHSAVPSVFRSEEPTGIPTTLTPSLIPSAKPTALPTRVASEIPTLVPSSKPSHAPTRVYTSITTRKFRITMEGFRELNAGSRINTWENITSSHVQTYWNSRSPYAADSKIRNISTKLIEQRPIRRKPRPEGSNRKLQRRRRQQQQQQQQSAPMRFLNDVTDMLVTSLWRRLGNKREGGDDFDLNEIQGNPCEFKNNTTAPDITEIMFYQNITYDINGDIGGYFDIDGNPKENIVVSEEDILTIRPFSQDFQRYADELFVKFQSFSRSCDEIVLIDVGRYRTVKPTPSPTEAPTIEEIINNEDKPFIGPGSDNNTGLVVGVVVGICLGLALAGYFYYKYRREKKKRKKLRGTGSSGTNYDLSYRSQHPDSSYSYIGSPPASSHNDRNMSFASSVGGIPSGHHDRNMSFASDYTDSSRLGGLSRLGGANNTSMNGVDVVDDSDHLYNSDEQIPLPPQPKKSSRESSVSSTAGPGVLEGIIEVSESDDTQKQQQQQQQQQAQEQQEEEQLQSKEPSLPFMLSSEPPSRNQSERTTTGSLLMQQQQQQQPQQMQQIGESVSTPSHYKSLKHAHSYDESELTTESALSRSEHHLPQYAVSPNNSVHGRGDEEGGDYSFYSPDLDGVEEEVNAMFDENVPPPFLPPSAFVLEINDINDIQE